MSKEKSSQKGRKIDDSQPYGVLWLDSYFQEVFLPNGEWQKVAQKVNTRLAENVKKQFGHEQRKQMIFELLGPDFVRKFFPHEEYKPTLVEVPSVSREERKKLHVDAQNWLQKELNKITSEVGCERPIPGQGHQSEPGEEMIGFLGQARFLALKNLDVHLYLQEKEVKRAWENYQWEQNKAKDQEREELERLKLRREYQRLTGTAPYSRSILRSDDTPGLTKPPPTAASIFTTVSEADRKPTANIKGAIYGAVEDPPTFWGMQSNSIGRSVAALLRRDPRRFGEVVARLHGRQLPGTLRTYIWLDILLRAERERLNDINAEKFVRERFGKALARGISELKVKRASHSPISGLIDNAVIEIYDRTPSMRLYMDRNQHMKEAAKALNILYVYDRTYEPYLIYWLFPLQVAFQDFSGQSEHIYDLAMYMDLLNKSCFPKWPQIFAVAEQVMARLDEVDKPLHDHLQKVSRINVNINPKEFLVQMIHQEKTKAQALLASHPGVVKTSTTSKELLADPRIFLRKWVGEGFVSVLDTQAVIYVWDQCFMQRWDLRVMEDFCLALLLLLRNEFMETKEYRDMRRVFLREPCKLYTMDVQHAWVHIQRGGQYGKVPGINRKTQGSRPTTIEPIAPRPFTPPSRIQNSPHPSIVSFRPLPPVGIKHLRLHLDIMNQSVKVNPSDIFIKCTVHFGTISLISVKSSVPTESPAIQRGKNGSMKMTVYFPKQRFVFTSLDTSQYDLELEMGGYPYAVLQVAMDTKNGPVPLGWARVKLFKSEAGRGGGVSSRPQWELMSGDYWHTVYAGLAPDQGARSISQHSVRQDSNAILGNSSQLGALVYDPTDEPLTPAPSPLQPTPHTPTPTPKPAPVSKTPERQKTPEIPGIKDTFVIYIDGVDNIPDNATITKVTGRLLKTGALTNVPDLLAPPDLASKARCPRYKYRKIVNEEKVATDVDMIALLRVYTVNRINGELNVIGSCLVEIFDKQTGKLRVGCHQRVLHYGMPELNQGLASLNHTGLDGAARIPGCTVYYRLAAHTEDFVEPSTINAENYPLDDRRLNDSEKMVINSYKSDKKHPKTTEDMARKLLIVEDATDEGKPIDQWILDRLDQKVHTAPSQGAGYLPLDKMVHYRISPGLKIHISRASGLQDGLYPECFAQIYPGEAAQSLQVTPEGYGRDDEKMITLKVDLDSRQNAPQWKDAVKTMHPHWDIHTVLVLQVFGLNIKYNATAEHQEPGVLTDTAGADLELKEENNIGWSVLPLFDELYTHTGEHHLPIFKGRPDPELIKEFSNRSVEDVLKGKTWDENNKLGNASLVVNIWDGHFNDGEMLEPLKRMDSMLEAVGDKEEYLKVQRDTQGVKLRQFVLDGLSMSEQAQGITGQAYLTEKELFAGLMEKNFVALMESSLMDAGYGPL